MQSKLPHEKAQEFHELLVAQSYAAVTQPIDFAMPNVSIPNTYVVCENDRAFPTSLQHQLSAGLGFKRGIPHLLESRAS